MIAFVLSKIDDTCNQCNGNIRINSCNSDTNSTHSSTSYYVRPQNQGYKINADLFSCESESVHIEKCNVRTLFLSEDLSISDSVNHKHFAENKVLVSFCFVLQVILYGCLFSIDFK